MFPWLWLIGLEVLTSPEKKIYDGPCFLQVQNGKVDCNGINKVACEISCDGEYMGRYHCSQKKGWIEKELPYCVNKNKEHTSPVCPENEVYSVCQGHCESSCSDWNKPVICLSKVCVGACVCGPGLVRGPGGKCISTDLCPVSTIEQVQGNHRGRRISFGCPDQQKCDQHCKEISRDNLAALEGRCIGENQLHCVCL